MLEVSASSFHAIFHACHSEWHIRTEKISFHVTYLSIEGYDTGDKRFGSQIQEVKAEDVTFSFVGHKVTLKQWKTLEKKSVYDDLYNPDKPRNLAKSVTVR